MRVLFISPHYPPDPASTGQLIEELVEDVTAAGHQAVVVTGRPSYTGRDHRPGNAKLLDVERRAGADIYWLDLPTAGRRGIWGRLVPFGSYFVGSTVLASFLKGIDVVYALSTPPLLGGLTACLLKQWRRIPFVYNLQDVYPEVAVALGILRHAPMIAASRTVEAQLRRRASALAVISDDMRARVLEQDPRLGSNVHVIRNWANPQAVQSIPHERNAFRTSEGLGDRFVVLYSGNLGRAHGAEVLPRVAERLRDLRDLVLLVIGEGPAKAAVERAVIERRLENVRFLPYQPKARLSETLSSADVSLVLQRADTRGLVVPSKLYGILASGRPVLAAVPAGSEVAEVVHRHRVGIVTRPEDADGIAAALRAFYADRPGRAAMGERARDRKRHV